MDGEPVQDMGRMWLDSVVLPQLEDMRTSPRHSDRIVSLHMIATLLSESLIKGDDVRCDILLNIALTLATDEVPNVRLSLAQALALVAELLLKKRRNGEDVCRRVESVLAALTTDRDRDVRYFAGKAKAVLQLQPDSEP
jgi:hypothetical protein